MAVSGSTPTGVKISSAPSLSIARVHCLRVMMKGALPGAALRLIETCKINGVGPFACPKATLTAVANAHPQNRINNLLPWNLDPSR